MKLITITQSELQKAFFSESSNINSLKKALHEAKLNLKITKQNDNFILEVDSRTMKKTQSLLNNLDLNYDLKEPRKPRKIKENNNQTIEGIVQEKKRTGKTNLGSLVYAIKIRDKQDREIMIFHSTNDSLAMNYVKRGKYIIAEGIYNSKGTFFEASKILITPNYNESKLKEEESDAIVDLKMRINDQENDLLQAQKDNDKERSDQIKQDLTDDKEKLKDMKDAEKQSESVLKESIVDSNELFDEMKKTFYKYFPNSYIDGGFKNNLYPSIVMRIALGKDKTEFLNGIIQNDPIFTSILVDGMNDNGVIGEKITLDGGGLGVSVKSSVPHLAYETVKIPLRKTTGSPDRILSTLDRAFGNLAKAVSQNADNLGVNFDVNRKIK